MINARAETVATSRAYAPSFARRRCLVPADGWYEWVRRPDGGRQAYFMTPRGRLGAGLRRHLVGLGVRADGPCSTFSVLTTAALGDLAEVHDRMPLLLPPERWAAWLGAGRRAGRRCSTAGAGASGSPGWRSVRSGAAVGDVRNDGPELIAPGGRRRRARRRRS